MISRSRAFFGYFRLFLVLSAVLCVAGCRSLSSRRSEEQAAGTPSYRVARPAAEAALVEALWSYHEAAITDVLKGIETGRYRQQDAGGHDFERALDFFEWVTGIPSNTATHFGRVVTPNLGDTLALWRQWYQANREQLRFLPDDCEIARRPSPSELLVALEKLGFFRYCRPEEVEKEKKAILERGWSGLFGENGRLYPIDTDELAKGGVSAFIGKVTPFLRAQGVRVPSLADEFREVEYTLIAGEERFPIWTQAEYERRFREPGLLSGLSAVRTVQILNRWLEQAGSAERALGVNGGYHFEVFFLTYDMFALISRHPDAEPHYRPYALTEEYPSFGQPPTGTIEGREALGQ